MRGALCTLVFALGLLATAGADAQDLKAWERKLDEAARAFEAKDYQAALEFYTEAQQILDAPKLRLQVAVVHEHLGQCLAAKTLYRSLLSEQNVDAGTRARAQSGLDEIESCRPADSADSSIEIEVAGAQPPSTAGRGRKRAGATLLVAGGLGLVGGTLLALHVFVPSRVADCAGLGGAAIDCREYAQSGAREGQAPLQLRNGARRIMLVHRLAGITAASVGAVAAVFGVGLLLTRGSTLSSASAVVSPRGLQVVLTW